MKQPQFPKYICGVDAANDNSFESFIIIKVNNDKSNEIVKSYAIGNKSPFLQKIKYKLMLRIILAYYKLTKNVIIYKETNEHENLHCILPSKHKATR
jgi:hypothetical protein